MRRAQHGRCCQATLRRTGDGAAGGHEDVVGLDVAVHHLHVVQIVHRLQY